MGLEKVLRLIKKSNTTPFEWLQSPIIYRETDGFRHELWELCSHYFHQKSNVNHYLGIAKSALDTIVNGDEIKIKKLFYILRPLLAAKWCLEKSKIAPMRITPLLTLMDNEMIEHVERLIELKSTASESFITKIEGKLLSYLNEQFKYCSDRGSALQKHNFDDALVTDFFIKTVKKYDDQRFKG